MHTSIVTIGDELLLGQVLNSNASWLAQQLGHFSIVPEEIVAVPDRIDAIRETLQRLWPSMDLVIMTGGLGPTRDDVTREAVADFLQVPLHQDDSVLEHMREQFAQRQLEMADVNRRLAQVPEGFEVLTNTAGTAPGLWLEQGGRILVLLPGVPHEMQTLMDEEVFPRLNAYTAGYHTYRILRTVGIPESELHEQLGELTGLTGEGVAVGFLPHLGGVRLRLSGIGDRKVVDDRLDRLQRYIEDRLGDDIYSKQDEGIEETVGRLLREKQLTAAAAESCTGGALVNRLTDVPGSSAYVRGGIIAYSNEVKMQQLGVDRRKLEEEGAVSAPVARQMARGVRECLGTDVGLSTTGIAGPSGGTPEKPVGTVWIGYTDERQVTAEQLHLTNDRIKNKELTVVAVLDMLRRKTLER